VSLNGFGQQRAWPSHAVAVDRAPRGRRGADRAYLPECGRRLTGLSRRPPKRLERQTMTTRNTEASAGDALVQGVLADMSVPNRAAASLHNVAMARARQAPRPFTYATLCRCLSCTSNTRSPTSARGWGTSPAVRPRPHRRGRISFQRDLGCLLHDRYGQGTHLSELAVQVRQLFVIHGPHDRAFLNLSSSRGAYPHARHPVNGKRASVNSVE
jgi:ribosomal protein L34E